jgi:beta-phosphoglucomutase-like phosphatase (HAD superfamily)
LSGVFDPPHPRYTAFIFDCDGTLADSMPLHHRAWIMAFRAHGGIFEFSWDLFMSRAGMALDETVRQLNRQFSLNMDVTSVIRAQKDHFLALMSTLEPIEPVVKFARDAAKSSPVSVASGGEPELVNQTLVDLGIHDLFPVIVTASEVPRGKPEPDLFLLAARRMGVRPEDCCVFEDSLLGIEAANKANMGSVLVRRPEPVGHLDGIA